MAAAPAAVHSKGQPGAQWTPLTLWVPVGRVLVDRAGFSELGPLHALGFRGLIGIYDWQGWV